MKQTKSKKNRFQRGLTLLEIILVLALFGVLMALFAPRVFLKNTPRTSDTLRSITVLSKKMMRQSRIEGVVYRLTFEIAENEQGQSTYKYWAEKSDSNKNPLFQAPAKGFSMAESLTKEPIVLPPQLKLIDAQTAGSGKTPLAQGKISIHYFPQGLTELAVLHFETERGIKWSLVTQPLTGTMEILKDFIDLNEVSPSSK